MVISRNWRYTGTETRQNFLLMLLVKVNFLKSFLPLLQIDSLLVIILCFFFVSVVHRARPPERLKVKTTFSEVKHRHDNPVASFKCARIKKSIIYITMRKQKALVNILSRSKAPKTQQNCHYRHPRKASWLFLWHYTGIEFSSRNNFANSGSFVKVSVRFQSSIYWLYTLISEDSSIHWVNNS